METHKTLFNSLDKAEKHFEAGQIKLAQKIVSEVSRLIKAEGKVSNKLRHRFNFMSAQSRYFNEISSFATNPKRNEIIEEIEKLISKPLENPKKQANEIHSLQTRWQLLDQTSKPASRDQWMSFKKLTDKAWEPCAQYYEELKAIKISNAMERKKIIEDINQYTNKYSGKWPGLIDMTKYLSKTFQSWQKFAPVLDEDFSKLKSEFHLAREPINDAIKDQENKNYKIKESLIKKVELISDDDNQVCIQKFKKIKREYQETGPSGKKNEPLLWKKLNEAADKFFVEEKAAANDELALIKNLSNELKEDNCKVNKVKNQIKDITKVRKSPEFIKLQKEVRAFEKKQISIMFEEKIEAYKDILINLEKGDAQNEIINKDILKVLRSPLYTGDEDALLESVVKLELIAQIDIPKSNQALKQKIALEMLQNKFSKTSISKDDIKNLLIKFINNLRSQKTNANEKKLWKRVVEVFIKVADQLP